MSAKYLWCFDDTGNNGDGTVCCFSTAEFWEAEERLDDQLCEIDELPRGFSNAMESVWEFNGSRLEAEKALQAAGCFERCEVMERWINDYPPELKYFLVTGELRITHYMSDTTFERVSNLVRAVDEAEASKKFNDFYDAKTREYDVYYSVWEHEVQETIE